MDENKQSLWEKVAKLMGDKGFYIILFLCVAVIGVSAWMILGSASELDETVQEPLSVTVSVPAPRETALTEPVHSEEADGSRQREQRMEPQLPAEPVEPVVPVPPTVQHQQTEAEEAQEPTELTLPESAPIPDAPEDSREVMAPVVEPETIPSYLVWPISGSVETPYSLSALVYSRTLADWRTHDGLDIAANLGAKVMAVADGTVEQIYTDQMLGTTVVILHSGGLRSLYANLAEIPAVRAGDTVALGDVIGAVGESSLAEIGDVTHLHFAMTLDGVSIDPQDVLPER